MMRGAGWVVLAAAVAMAGTAAAEAPVPARPVAEFLASLGVNTHTAWHGSPYSRVDGGADVEKIRRLLAYLGVSRIRDNTAHDWMLDAYAALARSGIGLNLFVSLEPRSDPLARQVRGMATLIPHLIGIEGPNETDLGDIHFDGKTGPAATRAAQAALLDHVRRIPALDGVPVIQSSIGHATSMPHYAGLGHADLANVHSYFFEFDKPISGEMPARIAEARFLSPGRAVVTTETGWPTRGPPGGYVDARTQAQLILTVLLAQFKAGVIRTFVYQLVDLPGYDDFYGLFEHDGAAKPAAVAMSNLTAILTDPRSPGAPGSLSLDIADLPGTADSLLLRHSDGAFWLVLWNGGQIWDSVRNTSIPLAPVQAHVTASIQESACLYDPLTGTQPTQVPPDADGRLAVPVPGHPVLLRLAADNKPCPAPQSRRLVGDRGAGVHAPASTAP